MAFGLSKAFEHRSLSLILVVGAPQDNCLSTCTHDSYSNVEERKQGFWGLMALGLLGLLSGLATKGSRFRVWGFWG